MKVPNFVEAIIGGYTDQQFKDTFRFLPGTINLLVEELRPYFHLNDGTCCVAGFSKFGSAFNYPLL